MSKYDIASLWLGEYGRLRSTVNRKLPTLLPKEEKEVVFSEQTGETHEESQPAHRLWSFVITGEMQGVELDG